MNRQVKYAVFIFLSLIAYFGFMKLLGLHENIWLRTLNFPIIFFWLYRMNDTNYKRNNYIEKFGLNLKVTAIAVVLFSLASFAYLSWINPDFLISFESTLTLNNYLSPGLISISIFIEGMASSVVLSLIVMQIFKNRIQIKTVSK